MGKINKEEMDNLKDIYGNDGCAYIKFATTQEDDTAHLQLIGDYDTTTYGLYKIITELAKNYDITFEEVISDLIYGKKHLEEVIDVMGDEDISNMSREDLEEIVKDIVREEDKMYN